MQIDHTLGLRRKLRALSVTTGRTGHRFTKQRCQRRATEHIFTAGEELTAGLISVPFLEESHGGGGLFVQHFIEIHELIAKHDPGGEFGFGEFLVGLGFADFEQRFGIGTVGAVVLAEIG